MICDHGDIVIVPFPFVDLAASKRRPSVVLSRRNFNKSNGHSICAMITTAARSRWASDIQITDLTSAGLQRACVIRWKLFTLPNQMILRLAGSLATRDRDLVTGAAKEILC